MRHGKVAVILSVDPEPETEIEQFGLSCTWVTCPQEVLDEVMGILRAKEIAKHVIKEGSDESP